MASLLCPVSLSRDGHAYRAADEAPLRGIAPSGQGTPTSYPMTLDDFTRPCAHLLFFPVLSRNPVDFDKRELSHNRLQN